MQAGASELRALTSQHEQAHATCCTHYTRSICGDSMRMTNACGGRTIILQLDMRTSRISGAIVYMRAIVRHAERKAQTYGKALVGLASLLCLSVCAAASHPRP